jgi:hypothetical protein
MPVQVLLTFLFGSGAYVFRRRCIDEFAGVKGDAFILVKYTRVKGGAFILVK